MYTKLDENIFYFESILKDPQGVIKEIEYLDQFLNESTSMTPWRTWHPNDSDHFVYGDTKDYNQNLRSEDTELNKRIAALGDKLKTVLDACINIYGVEKEIYVGFNKNLMIKKYDEGQQMGPHVDSMDDSIDVSDSTVSAVLYLNDDYVGGELNFVKQGVKIKPKAGSVVVFPSHRPYFHESLPLIKGTKYMSPIVWAKLDWFENNNYRNGLADLDGS